MARKKKAPREYQLIDLTTGVSYGGFATLDGARECAREEGLTIWEVWRNGVRVERHDPDGQG